MLLVFFGAVTPGRSARKLRMKYCIATAALLVIPSVALSQARVDEPPHWLGLSCAAGLLLLLAALLVLLAVVLWRSGAMRQGTYLGIARDHIERANAHMERQEERELRIIELLESIELELKHRDSIKKL
jgi:hypothetical protein